MNTRIASRMTAFLTSACAILLAACGGGGGYGGSSNPMSPPTVTIAVAPATIVLGQSATVTWTSNTPCTASDAWTGAQASSGSLVVTPTATGAFNYTLTCSGTGYMGDTVKTATLTVNAATAYSTTNLVGDTAAAGALTVDTNLVNPWGITFGPTSPVWVANNHSDTSTLYNGNGATQALVVSVPAGFGATGIVFNSSTDFVVGSGAATGAARFIYSGEGGMIAGWSPTADATHALVAYTATDGAVYKGLAIAANGAANYLYATDFVNGKVNVFNATFAKQTSSATAFTFTDPNLPAGYAPFGIQALKTGAAGATQIYVTYAMRQDPPTDD
ncbi:MAG: TIGR03118 family protein, partial [Steroidobacteraceae bacterium]